MFVALLALSIAQAGPNPYSVKLDDGTVVTLVSVSDDPKNRAWAPGGGPTKSMAEYGTYLPAPKMGAGGHEYHPKGKQYAFVVNVELAKTRRGSKGGYDSWLPSVQSLVFQFAKKVGPKTWKTLTLANAPKGVAEFDLDLTVADTDWKAVESAKFKHGKLLSSNSFSCGVTDLGLLEGGVMKGEVDDRGFPMVLPYAPNSVQQQVAAYDANGQELMSGGSVMGPTFERPKSLTKQKGVFLFAYFIEPKDVARIEVQQRPWKSIRFRHVHLSPITSR